MHSFPIDSLIFLVRKNDANNGGVDNKGGGGGRKQDKRTNKRMNEWLNKRMNGFVAVEFSLENETTSLFDSTLSFQLNS